MAQNRHKIPTSGYNPTTKELFFSWRSDEAGGDDTPDRTAVFNLEFNHCSYMDHGFTSMVNHQSYNQMTLRDFLIETIIDNHDASICDCDDSLDDVMQGNPYVIGRTSSFTDATCDISNGSSTVNCDSTSNILVGLSVTGSGIPSNTVVSTIVNATSFTMSKQASATTTNVTLTFKTAIYPSLWKGSGENTGSCSLNAYKDKWNCEANSGTWTATTADSDSLCAKMGNIKLEHFCEEGTEGSTFVMASSSDKCLKQYEEDYYQRDIYNGSAYVNNGYHSILESGALHFDTDDEKILQRVTLEYSGVGSSFTNETCDTNSNTTVTCDSNNKIKPGQSVSGSGIPDGTIVSSVNTDNAVTSFTLSKAATATATNVTLTFTVPVTAAMKFGKSNQPDQLLSGINYTLLSGTQILDDQSATAGSNNSDIINNNINPDDKAYFNNYTRGRYLGYQIKLSGNGPAIVSRVTLSTRLGEK